MSFGAALVVTEVVDTSRVLGALLRLATTVAALVEALRENGSEALRRKTSRQGPARRDKASFAWIRANPETASLLAEDLTRALLLPVEDRSGAALLAV